METKNVGRGAGERRRFFALYLGWGIPRGVEVAYATNTVSPPTPRPDLAVPRFARLRDELLPTRSPSLGNGPPILRWLLVITRFFDVVVQIHPNRERCSTHED